MADNPSVFRRIAIRTLPPRMVVGKGFSHQQVWDARYAFNKAVLSDIRSFATQHRLEPQADFDGVSVMDRLPVMFLPCTAEFFDALNQARLPGIKPWPKTYRSQIFSPR